MGIKRGHYYVKGINESIGNVEAQERIAKLEKDEVRGIVMDTYLWDKCINLTIQDFSLLRVPAKGQTITMDSTAVKLYSRPIENEKDRIGIYGEENIVIHRLFGGTGGLYANIPFGICFASSRKAS